MKCSLCKEIGHMRNNKKFHIPDKSESIESLCNIFSKIDILQNKSVGLSQRISEMNKDGRHLNDDSFYSERTLSAAMDEIITYTKQLFKSIDATIEHVKLMSLYECQEYFHVAGGPSPNPDNKRFYMKPDGGIIIMTLKNKRIPILIVEDKVQGTNDNLFRDNKKRQATGNAVERAGKNIRGAEMLFSGLEIFPYILFASGCDFHSSETISKRIEMMNMGVPNHYIDISSTPQNIDSIISDININIKKICGKSIASVFVKAHKWDKMVHGSSLWKKDEIVKICKKVIDNVYESFAVTS